MNKYFGVNLAGSEFDGGNPAQNVPGIYNKDYIYPTDINEHNYYVKKGLTLFRLPLRWERIQRTLLGDLNTDELAHIHTVLDTAHTAGAKVILDLHNYGQYQTAPNQLTPVTLGNEKNLSDVWVKLATFFHDHPALFGYELMNEPHDLPDGQTGWEQICQNVTTAIEAVDNTHFIIIPGYDWQSGDRWKWNTPVTGKNIVYSAHQYFDGDASGGYWFGDATNANGTGRIQHFIDWLKAHSAQGLVTEYGVPFGTGATTPLKKEWYPVLEDFLTTLQNAPEIIGATAWAGGPWWGTYNLTIEPSDAPTTYAKDRESMAIYAKFPSSGVTPVPTPVPSVPILVPTPPTPTPIPNPVPVPSVPVPPTPTPQSNPNALTFFDKVIILVGSLIFITLIIFDVLEYLLLKK